MSYCRWSSMNWKCDLYCYGSSAGYEIHVGGNRIVGDVPHQVEWFQGISDDEFSKRHRENMAFLEDADRKSIGLQFDGQSYTLSTLEDFKDKLLELREAGYIFPDHLLEEIDEEIECESTS